MTGAGWSHPDDTAAVLEQAQAHIAGETPLYEVEHRMLHRDGSIRWFLVRGSVTRNAQGTAIHMAGTDTDITARKRSEEALRQAEELNRRIAESTHDCVKVLAIDGRLIYMNTAGLQMLEMTDARALLNRSFADLFEGEVRQAAEEAVAQAQRGGRGRFQYRDANFVGGGEVVGRRGDANQRCRAAPSSSCWRSRATSPNGDERRRFARPITRCSG